MTTRRLLVGMTMMFGLSVWAWCRADERSTDHPSTDTATAAATTTGGNHDEAAARFRSGQSCHWRHVMVGGR
jgi:hypothetical protein